MELLQESFNELRYDLVRDPEEDQLFPATTPVGLPPRPAHYCGTCWNRWGQAVHGDEDAHQCAVRPVDRYKQRAVHRTFEMGEGTK